MNHRQVIEACDHAFRERDREGLRHRDDSVPGSPRPPTSLTEFIRFA